MKASRRNDEQKEKRDQSNLVKQDDQQITRTSSDWFFAYPYSAPAWDPHLRQTDK